MPRQVPRRLKEAPPRRAPPDGACAGRTRADPKQPIRIGIVNNMPDAALLATERQFMRLLDPALLKRDVHVRLFYLPEIARSADARRQLLDRYAPVDALPNADIDALIVTGCEPVRSSLADEPYWRGLVELIDWTRDNTVSTIWSCLAAHAAVLHLDGIVRQKLPRKLAGIYEFDRISDHPLLQGLTAPVQVPHSRLNGLNAGDLIRRGYEMLTHSDDAGADAFVKQYQSLFVFLQGHPEYDADSLYREYRRDMTRYLDGRQRACPALPENYFDRDTATALNAFAEEARCEATAEFLERFLVTEMGRLSRADWRTPAARLFANWIGYVAEARKRRAHLSREHVGA